MSHKIFILAKSKILYSNLADFLEKMISAEIIHLSHVEELEKVLFTPKDILLICDFTEDEVNTYEQALKAYNLPIIKMVKKEEVIKDFISASTIIPIDLNDLLIKLQLYLQGNEEFYYKKSLHNFELSFNYENYKIIYLPSNTEMALTKKEAEILKALFNAYPKFITKEELLSKVWNIKSKLESKTLESHIYNLRKKISESTLILEIQLYENGYKIAFCK